MNKPYVVVMNKNDHNKRYALDRNYNLMHDMDEIINTCCIGDIVQVCTKPAASFDTPKWVEKENPDNFISIWFNYYD
jgi:hypothetical protein